MQMNHISKNRPMWIASATALCVVLFFAFAVHPDLSPVRRYSPAPLRISHVSDQEKLGPMRDLWSPVLFALPSRGGFSKAFLDSRNFEREPSKRTAAHADLFLNTPAEIPALAAVRFGRPQKPDLQITAGKTPSIFAPVSVDSGVHLRVENGLASRLIRQPNLAGLSQFAGGWQQSASITVSPAGQVTHVFVEPNGESGVAAPQSLISLLYQMRFQANTQESQGRVTVYALKGEASK